MTNVAGNMNVCSPFLMEGGIALAAEFVPQARVFYQPIHGVEQLLVSVEDKAAAAFLDNLRHAAYISHNDGSASGEGFEDDDPEHLIPDRRNNRSDGLFIQSPKSVARFMPKKLYIGRTLRHPAQLRLIVTRSHDPELSSVKPPKERNHRLNAFDFF